jgi:exosortase C (VPDSG-CTERM-specific)
MGARQVNAVTPDCTSDKVTTVQPPGGSSRFGRARRLKALAACGAVLGVCFAKPLIEFGRFAAGNDLFSHALLVPLISGYFIWRRRRETCAAIGTGSFWAVVPGLLSAALLGAYWLGDWRGSLAPAGYLCLMTTAFLGFLLAAALAWLGRSWLRVLPFPVAFLVFMIPFPGPVTDAVEVFLQHASADVADVMLLVSGMPLLRDGLVFKLPGITLRVAQECSGIHSSLVLLITSFVAGQLLLRSAWRRWVLALLVIPLGILRNGFRVFTLAMLCVHIDVGLIDSALHHRGGPIFFALSLVPFLLLLLWLRKGEAP